MNKTDKNFFVKVYDYLKTVPKGKVVTYGQIARAIGSPRSSRAVGYALHANPDPENIPCYKVVNRDGKLSSAFVFGGINIQKFLLNRDGIEVSDDYTVDLEKYLFRD
ncbi:MAG: MGMT family protein [Clostridia bacterium]|nr:MGMT family protein [Clostridia bacterium]